MRIAYVNANYQKNHTGGGYVHIGQFIKHALALGHEIWAYPGNQHPGVKTIPTDRVNHILTMRRMDVYYVRLESSFVDFCTWSKPPRRTLYNFPIVVWEFNTTPEQKLVRGQSIGDVEKTIIDFKRYSRGCDLAICMTENLANYVQNNYFIDRVLLVPNGSDPDLFKPDTPTARRMTGFQGLFNIVWIGSGKEKWHDLLTIKRAAQKVCDLGYQNKMAFHLLGSDITGLMAEMPPNVFYWGAEYYSRLPTWLSAMDVGLSLYRPGPADYATPLKVFDYMSNGLAVVSTPSPFMMDLFEQLNQSELMVPPGDAQILADVLLNLLQDRNRVKQLGMAGRQLVIEKYNWQRAVEDTMDAIEALMQEKGLQPKR